jgi:hypothetical protein
MRKILFPFLFLHLVVIPAYAQQNTREQSPVRFGIRAGLNSSNMTINNDGSVNDKKAVLAWQVGAVADIPLLPILSLQPGLFLNSKGSKLTIGDHNSDNYSEVSIRPLYVEIPVNLVFKLPLSESINLFAGAGPYAAIGIGGKNKIEGKLAGVSYSDDSQIEYGNDDPQTGSSGSYQGDLKRFDFGLNFLAGLEINRLTLNANYGYGMVNINPGQDNSDAKYQNRVISLVVGVLF